MLRRRQCEQHWEVTHDAYDWRGSPAYIHEVGHVRVPCAGCSRRGGKSASLPTCGVFARGEGREGGAGFAL